MARPTKLKGFKNQITIQDEQELKYIHELFTRSLEEKEGTEKKNVNAEEDAGQVMLIQPKCVTYSVLESTPMIESLITEVIRKIQNFLSGDAYELMTMQVSMNIWMKLDFSIFPHYNANPQDIEPFLKELESKRFGFNWVQKAYTDSQGILHPEEKFGFSGVMFTGHAFKENSKQFRVQLNPMAVPYLLFIGRGMGYTEFDYNIFNSLKSVYSQRLYKLVCDWAQRDAIKEMTISQLREYLGISEDMKYKTHMIKVRILDYTSKILSDMNSKVNFAYEFKSKSCIQGSAGRKKFDTIVFCFKRDKSNAIQSRNYELQVNTMTVLLKEITDSEKYPEIEPLARRLVSNGEAKKLYSKFVYYRDQLMDNVIDGSQYKNILLKLCREDYGVDLRCNKHIRNSKVRAVKKELGLK